MAHLVRQLRDDHGVGGLVLRVLQRLNQRIRRRRVDGARFNGAAGPFRMAACDRTYAWSGR